MISSRYFKACLDVFIGGDRFGIIIARPICFAVIPTTELISKPSLRCKCQSYGLIIVSCFTLYDAVLQKNIVSVSHGTACIFFQNHMGKGHFFQPLSF